jgi:predicted metal-dependent hydrolase
MAHDSESDAAGYEPLYLAGIEKFNACDYYESHEVWEELWTEYRGPSRQFYQGLIQAAVALYHFGNGNIRGARKLHGSVHRYLEPYAPRHLGLDVTSFLGSFDTCLAEGPQMVTRRGAEAAVLQQHVQLALADDALLTSSAPPVGYVAHPVHIGLLSACDPAQCLPIDGRDHGQGLARNPARGG